MLIVWVRAKAVSVIVDKERKFMEIIIKSIISDNLNSTCDDDYCYCDCDDCGCDWDKNCSGEGTPCTQD